MALPPSIVAFERLYLGSLVLYLANTAVFWSRTQALMNQSELVQANPALGGMIGPIMIVVVLATVAVTMLLWYLVARQGNAVGKWLVVSTEAIGGAFGVLAVAQLARDGMPETPNVLIGLVVTLLAIVAAAMLFRPDARAWFASDHKDVSLP